MEPTANSSYATLQIDSDFDEKWQTVVKTFVLALTTFFILFGNSFCLLVLRNTDMNEASRQCMYSLSLSDLMVGITITVPATIASPFGYWPLGDTMCFLSARIGGAIALTTSWALVALSVERYFAICFPLRYPVLVALRRTRVALVLIWLGALAYETLVAYIYNFKVFYDTPKCTCWFISTSSGNWILYISILIYLICPLIIIVTLYGRMFHIAGKHLKRIRSERLKAGRYATRRKKTKSKAAVTFGIITGAYGICALSGIIFSLYENIAEKRAPKYASFLVFLTVYGNSWVNVAVYYWRTRPFRQAAKDMISKAFGIDRFPQARKNPSDSSSLRYMSRRTITTTLGHK